MVTSTILDHPRGDEFYRAYGRATIAWNKLEHELCIWFALLLHAPVDVGEAIFYSAKSFQGKSTLIEEVLATDERRDTVSAEDAAFLKKAVKKAVQFNTFRNTIAHGVPYAGTRSRSLALATGRGLKSLGTAELIESETLELAAANFIALQQILRAVFMHACARPGVPPEAGLKLLLALPTRADRPLDGQKLGESQFPPES